MKHLSLSGFWVEYLVERARSVFHMKICLFKSMGFLVYERRDLMHASICSSEKAEIFSLLDAFR